MLSQSVPTVGASLGTLGIVVAVNKTKGEDAVR